MPTAALSGKGGSVYIPGTPNVAIAEINNWTCQIDAENYDATALGDNWKEFVAGLRGFSGQISGFYAIPSDTTGQYALWNALLTGASVVLQMQTATGGGYFEGNANITQVSITDPVNNLITIQFNYVGTGSLQHNP